MNSHSCTMSDLAFVGNSKAVLWCLNNFDRWHYGKYLDIISFFFLLTYFVNALFIGEPAEAEARARASNEDGEIKRVSTKEWAKSTGYDPVKLFTKVRFFYFR